MFNIGNGTNVEARPQLANRKVYLPSQLFESSSLQTCVYQDVQARTTTGTAEETVASVSIAANAIAEDGRGLLVEAWGTTDATANNKTVAFKLGGSTLITTGAIAANAKPWHLWMKLYRQAAASQFGTGGGQFNAAIVAQQNIAGAEDWTTALTLAIRVTDATALGGTLLKGWAIYSI